MVNGSSSEIGSFALGILVIKNPDGSNLCEIEHITQNVSEETIIMQLKAFLKEKEKRYFESYRNDSEKPE